MKKTPAQIQKRFEERHPEKIKAKNRKKLARYHLNKKTQDPPADDLRIILDQKLKG